jgi:hypothetical protein
VLPAVTKTLRGGEGPVAATLYSAAAVHTSGRTRVRLPSPWLVAPWAAGQSSRTSVLLTNMDQPGARRTVMTLSALDDFRISAAWQDGEAWAVLMERTSQPVVEESSRR